MSTTRVAQDTDTGANGAVRDEVPKLTKGGVLIDQAIWATIRHVRKAGDRGLSKAMAEARLRLQAYVTEIEREAGVYENVANNTGGRPKTKGWCVCKTRHGTWRLVLTSLSDGRPKQVGTFTNRLEAEERGIELVAELRKDAA